MRWVSSVIIIFLVLSNAASARESLMVATGEFPPYASGELPEGGFLNEVIITAFELGGMDANKVFLPWARGFMGVEKMHFDVTAPYIWTKQRAATLRYSDALYELAVAVFVRDEEAHLFHHPDDFIGHTWCLPRNYATDLLDSYLRKGLVTLIRSPSDKACLEMVARKRVSAYAMDLLIGKDLLEKNPELFEGISNLPWAIKKNTYHLVVSKNHPRGDEILTAFNRGLKQLRDSRQWRDILRRHKIPENNVRMPNIKVDSLFEER